VKLKSNFASSGGNNNMYYNGAGGNASNRSLINANGTIGARNQATLSSSTAGVALPANFNDYALSASGRVLALGQGAVGTGSSGFWVSDVNRFVSNNFALSQNFAFSVHFRKLSPRLPPVRTAPETVPWSREPKCPGMS